MISISRALLCLLPAAGALAAPALSVEGSAPVGIRERTPEFYQRVRDLIGNVTVSDTELEKRTTVFSNSQDGVDSAGFYYSLYNANGASAGYTEYPTSGTFELGWNCKTEFLGGKGYKSTTPRSLSWNGYFSASGDYTLAIYGWTLNPVTEWYIVEQHGTGTPGNGHPVGTVSSDGGTYEVYDLYYQNVPEIYGVTSFHQYWSVRQSPRTTGTVNVANHFNGWKSHGLAPGAPIFQMVTLEGFSGQGYLNFTVG